MVFMIFLLFGMGGVFVGLWTKFVAPRLRVPVDIAMYDLDTQLLILENRSRSEQIDFRHQFPENLKMQAVRGWRWIWEEPKIEFPRNLNPERFAVGETSDAILKSAFSTQETFENT